MGSDIISTNEIAEFMNQLYFKQEFMNEVDFWHADIDSKNGKDSF